MVGELGVTNACWRLEIVGTGEFELGDGVLVEHSKKLQQTWTLQHAVSRYFGIRTCNFCVAQAYVI